jgi:hypothetical protein
MANYDGIAIENVKNMASNQISVAFVGGGAISTALSNCLPVNVVLKTYSIREIKLTDSNCEMINVIKQADLVVYLGYHHRNLFVNLVTLYKILRHLSFAKWKGLFVFFNTQAALDANCYKDLKPIPQLFKHDIYRLTKRIQSGMLKIFDSDISISEVYLPVVVGRGTKTGLGFEKIALHKDIYMPNSGANKIVLLDLPNFSSWFWVSSKNYILNEPSNLSRRLFVFDDIKSTNQLINEFRQKNSLPYIGLKQYNAAYWFSDNFLRNLIWMFKKSPIGLLLYIITGLFKKSKSLALVNEDLRTPEKVRIDGEIFVPDDIEYMASAREILLDKIKFDVLDIGNAR